MYPFPELIPFLQMILYMDWAIWSEGHDHFWRQITKTVSSQLNVIIIVLIQIFKLEVEDKNKYRWS